jgi:flagellar hook-length control protein FliK
MASSQRQQADLVLNPPQLGRVEISLTVNGDQASVTFASPNAEVRELLEGSLPRLREILSGAGINLGEAQVGSESASQFGTQDQKSNNAAARGVPLPAEIGTESILLATQRGTLTGRGMVDIFA